MTTVFTLPEPSKQGQRSLEECLFERKSIREFTSKPITVTQIGQILWAAQGRTNTEGHRTAPSAGALYPLEILLATGIVQELETGAFRYIPDEHGLELIIKGEVRDELAVAALDQDCVRNGAAVLILTAIPERITGKYGQRGHLYMYMEAGHVAQNIYLQATALGLGTVAVGAFYDNTVKRILQLPPKKEPLYILPIGHPH